MQVFIRSIFHLFIGSIFRSNFRLLFIRSFFCSLDFPESFDFSLDFFPRLFCSTGVDDQLDHPSAGVCGEGPAAAAYDRGGC